MKQKILKINAVAMTIIFAVSCSYCIGAPLSTILNRFGVEFSGELKEWIYSAYLSEWSIFGNVLWMTFIMLVIGLVTVIFYRKRFSVPTLWLLCLGWLIPQFTVFNFFNAYNFILILQLIISFSYVIATLCFLIRDIKNFI